MNGLSAASNIRRNPVSVRMAIHPADSGSPPSSGRKHIDGIAAMPSSCRTRSRRRTDDAAALRPRQRQVPISPPPLREVGFRPDPARTVRPANRHAVDVRHMPRRPSRHDRECQNCRRAEFGANKPRASSTRFAKGRRCAVPPIPSWQPLRKAGGLVRSEHSRSSRELAIADQRPADSHRIPPRQQSLTGKLPLTFRPQQLIWKFHFPRATPKRNAPYLEVQVGFRDT